MEVAPHAHPHVSTLDYLLAVIDGKPGVAAACVRAGLRVLSWVYGAGLHAYLATFALGLSRVERLPAEVVAVGNLSMGGTGKTLAVQRLAREYLAQGKRVAILSRGHKRQVSGEPVVLCRPGEPPPSAEYGDEPALLAASLPGVPVLLGKNRRRTGRRAIEEFGAEVLILDDGSQYWRLRKDREIVLLDALQPAAREHLLPRGIFRVPWSHLRTAGEVWITHAQLATPERVAELSRRTARHAPKARLRRTEHTPERLRTLSGEVLPLERLRDLPILALSGLGHPEQYEAMLAGLGARVTPSRYPDHHLYTPADLTDIATRLTPGMPVVTTAKDAVRLPSTPPFPVWVIEVEMADVSVGKEEQS